MAEIVQFTPDQTDKQEVIDLLEAALADARAGKVKDVAIITAQHDREQGPMFVFSYYGDGAYSSLLAGVSALEFDLHYHRYNPEDEE